MNTLLSISGFGDNTIYIVIIFLVVLGGGFISMRSKITSISGPILSLRSFKIDESSSSEVQAEIVGRASGLTGWFLTILNLSAETTLKVTRTDISFKSSSLAGEINQVVPFSNVSSTHCSYTKPIGVALIGIFLFIIALFAGQIIAGLIILVLFLFVYWLRKKATISIETSGGLILGIAFNRSIIENVSIDIEQAIRVTKLINENMVKSKGVKA